MNEYPGKEPAALLPVSVLLTSSSTRQSVSPTHRIQKLHIRIASTKFLSRTLLTIQTFFLIVHLLLYSFKEKKKKQNIDANSHIHAHL